MDQITLADRRIADGQRLVLQLAQDEFDFTAAFWLRPVDDNWWHLYVASKLVEDQDPAVAYRKVQTSLRQLPGTTISLSDVKLIEATDPLAHDILKIRKHYTGVVPIRFGGARLGDLLVEEALIYPPFQKGKQSAYTKKAAENVQKFLDLGWKLAKEQERGRPVVFREQYDGMGNVIWQERVFVDETMTPERLEQCERVPAKPDKDRLEPIEPA